MGSRGVPSIEEIIERFKKTESFREVMDNVLSIKYPDSTKTFIKQLINKSMSVLETIPVDPSNHDYNLRFRVGDDTFIFPVLIDSTERAWLDEYAFITDTINNCYRKIYYTKDAPVSVAGCYLNDLNDGMNHGLLVVKGKEGQLEKLKEKELLHIAHSFRLKENNIDPLVIKSPNEIAKRGLE